MVHMHPSRIPANIQTSEKPIFQSFLDTATLENWHVFHSLDMHADTTKAQGEIDFVVLVPGRGLVVIEVKGATSLEIDENGWHFEGLPESNESPIDQLNRNRNDLIQYLKTRVGLFPVARALWLPKISNSDLADFSGDISFSRWEILTQDNVKDAVQSVGQLLENYLAVKNLNDFRPSEQFDGEVFNKTVNALGQQFKATASKRTVAKSHAEELDETEYGFDRIYELINRNPNVFLSGPAGTGKSGYLRRFVLDCYEEWNKDNRVLLLSWGELVADHNTNAYSSYHDLEIWDVGALMLEITGLNKEDAKHHADFYTRYLPELAITKIPGSRFENFDMIAIDEFQDIATRPSVFEFIRALAKHPDFKGTRLILAADERQQIMRDKDMPPVEDAWAAALALTPNLTFVRLSDNYRNSEEIGIVVEKLAQEEKLYSTYQIQGVEHPVEIIEVNASTQRAKYRDALNALLKEFECGDICVLSPYRDDSISSMILSGLDTNPIALEIRENISAVKEDPNRVFTSTIQKFKGLESHAVVVTDLILSPRHLESEESMLRRMKLNIELLYVAVSRANYKVILLCDEHMIKALKALGI